MTPPRDHAKFRPAVYAVSVPAGVLGALSLGVTSGILVPLAIGAASGGAVGWWVNQIIAHRQPRK